MGPVPLRVGLVTSGGSAAYHDFLQELAASGYAFRVAHADVRVQGGAASRRIAYALRRLGQLDLDVIVVVRGGGARSDLAPFDSEIVARVIAELPHPGAHRHRPRGRPHRRRRGRAFLSARRRPRPPGSSSSRVDEFCARLSRISHRVSLRARADCVLAARELDATRPAGSRPARPPPSLASPT